MVQVKTCGLNAPEAVAQALDAGADYLGFIHYERSPRHVSLDETAVLVQAASGKADTVQVVVDPSDRLADALAQACDMVQLHGKESVARVEQLARRIGKPLIKAVSVRSAAEVEAAQAYLPHVHALLFDAKPPQEGDWLPGGNGLSFDWSILDQAWLKDTFWFLSGGLDAQNVAQAIALTRAPAVDVSSGLESAPGVKDLAKIRAFVDAAKKRAE